MRITLYLLLPLSLTNCAKQGVLDDPIPLSPEFAAFDVNPVTELFGKKAKREEWVKASTYHLIGEEGEGIFYFELGYRAFVLFDEFGVPTRYEEY